MIESTSKRTVAWLSLACALIARSASAQPADSPDTTTEQARALYVEGKELRRQGDLDKSLDKFQAAFALHPTAITALEVGRARSLVGQLRSAIESLEAIERMPLHSNESDKAAAARVEARELAAQLRARAPSLRVLIDGAGTRVWVDGDAIPTDQLDHWLVDPGTHHVEAARGERRAAEDLRVLEGEVRTVVLQLSVVAAHGDSLGPRDAPVAPSPHEVDEAPAPGPNGLAYLGFGIGGAGLVTGTVTGVLTLSQAGDLKKQCSGGVCPPSAGLDTTQTLATVSTVAFVVGGAGIALGITALAVRSRGPEVRKQSGSKGAAWVRPWVGIAAGGLEGVF
jgi:hypothetical protein